MDIIEIKEKSKTIRAEYEGKYHVKWPGEFKQSVLKLLDDGTSLKKISKATGIAEQTITNWRPGSKRKSKSKKFKQMSVRNIDPPSLLMLSWSEGLEVTGISFEQFRQLLREGLL